MTNKYISFDIETTGLFAWYGCRITCICAKDSDGNIYETAGDDEKQIIQGFVEFVKERPEHFLLSANGIEFDVPFIMARGYLSCLKLIDTQILIRRRHFDLMNLTSKKISLQNLSVLYGCKGKNGNWKDAIVFFGQKKWDELIKYCMNDVEVTEKVYLKWIEIKDLEEKDE